MSGTTTRVEADGALVINKPKAITSMDVVRAVRRITRVKRVGHAGTLDPIAEGVLPVCLGQATRFMDYLVDSGKTYLGEITFGTGPRTRTTRRASRRRPATMRRSTREQIEEQLPRFTGVVLQRPPMYSAVKHEGQRLYDLARGRRGGGTPGAGGGRSPADVCGSGRRRALVDGGRLREGVLYAEPRPRSRRGRSAAPRT